MKAATTPRQGAQGAKLLVIDETGLVAHHHAADPGDMDTPLHALAVPDADPATLRRPRDAAREIVERIDHERAARVRSQLAPRTVAPAASET